MVVTPSSTRVVEHDINAQDDSINNIKRRLNKLNRYLIYYTPSTCTSKEASEYRDLQQPDCDLISHQV